MVVNGEPEFNGDRTEEILNPLLVVEVLSPPTEAYDRGEKFRKYRSIASFCEYLLVSQAEPYIEQYYIIMAIAKIAIVGNGKCAIGSIGRSYCTV